MSIELVNVRYEIPPGCVYIGRRTPYYPQSPLHNMYRLTANTSREQAIAWYRRYLWRDIQARGEMWEELNRLVELYAQTGSLCLGCWCKPQACHGDVVITAIKWLGSQRI